MRLQLKPISADAIPEALSKVERYRLLNEPSQAQSICEDILSVDPHNEEALIMLLLSITDQFDHGGSAPEARQVLSRLATEYHRAYYEGIISERTARMRIRGALPGSNFAAYEELQEAMAAFEKAEAVRPPGNDDAILRWNACARLLMRNPSLQPRHDERVQEVLGE